MKLFTTICKLFAVAATIAGAVYVIATYGDKIVAWAKKLLESCPCHNCACQTSEEAPVEETVEDPAEEAEEAPAEETEESPAEDETEPTAEPADFEN